MTKKTKRKPGRPAHEFDQKVADKICSLIIEGKSLKRICAMKLMPSIDTVMRWLAETPSFHDQYARAREEQAEGYADQLVELSRKANAQNAHAIRVQVDVIKWVCSKLKPKKYGDRLELQADINLGAAGGAESKPFAELTKAAKMDRLQRTCFVLHELGIEVAEEWGLPWVAEAAARLSRELSARALAVLEGRAPPPEAKPAALPAPRLITRITAEEAAKGHTGLEREVRPADEMGR